MNWTIILRIINTSFIFTVLFMQAACNDGGKYGKFEDKKVLSEYRRCLTDPNPSRNRSIICDNYERECKRRKSNGNNICAL